ncbi:MAG: esterase [Bacteroidetes bacterium]|jgi:carboxylesterase|nr:esterase [Bacteroidota bacterium]MBT6684889.1 esterase [Bacteroidota bacterium]MBT7141693.1 esterase [Bacteroidota bacterium]MBT7492787.1 esterase [Bacteroidota bacterium]
MKTTTFKIFTYLLIGSFLLACDKNPTIEDHMLDGNFVFDPSINNPHEFLISAKYPNPTAEDLEKHIIIAAHGYTATTFEWSEFQEWSSDSSYRISQVLLGGHGTSYEDFKTSTWEDWSESIKLEFETLVSLGYEKISLVGSSTGATLLLELIMSDYFEIVLSPKNVFLIDPIVVPSAKLQSIVGIIGPMVVYAETDNTTEDDKYWYHFRPYETINELNELMKNVQKGLEDGFSLPNDTYMKVFHSKNDPTANSISTVLIYKGLTNSNGGNIDVQIMDSDIHVFTRLKLRESVSQLNLDNQEDAFLQMAQKLSQ